MAEQTYTYEWQFRAFLGDDVVIIPDQITNDRAKHNAAGTIFATQDGKRVKLLSDNARGCFVQYAEA